MSNNGDEPEEPKAEFTQEMVEEGLSMIGKVHDGSTYANQKLVLEEKEVEVVGPILKYYRYLKYVSVANNKLKDLRPIAEIQHLLTLDANTNEIESLEWLNEEVPEFKARAPRPPPEEKPKTPEEGEEGEEGDKQEEEEKPAEESKDPAVEESKEEGQGEEGEHEQKEMTREEEPPKEEEQQPEEPTVYVPGLQYLQIANFSTNQIKALPHIAIPLLRSLNLNTNEIINTDAFCGHSRIQYLDISKNKLKSLKNISNMPELLELNVEGNELECIGINSLKNLPKLQVLILKTNQLKRFGKQNPPVLPSLKKLDLSENQMENQADFFKMKNYPTLESLAMVGNPGVDELGDLKKEILIRLPELKNIKLVNEDEITEDDREEAAQEKIERIKAEEEAKREAEEEARRQAEEGKEGGEENQEED